ncbi:MAG: cupin domain-containing protein [Chromatiaceae bacterium]|nr:cupin domain-containing protein [Chromatiaceae bacterium]MCP5315826.1 cupin domain-containing protein [Chromatiaceae bacterium]
MFCMSGRSVAFHAEPVQVDVLAKSEASWNGQELPAYPQGRPEVTILKITVPPHTRLAWHRHTVINAGVLLSGALTVETEDGQILRLVAGESIVEVVGKLHFGRNDGDEPAEIIVFYAGIKGEPVTIKMPDDAAARH